MASWSVAERRARERRVTSSAVFELLRDEVEGSRPGTNAILAKLADVFLAQVLRNFLVGAEAYGIRQLPSFTDPAIARAVELLHTFPARSWTVAGLGAEVGMSLTLFGTRFRELLGEAPIHYLARVRLSQGGRLPDDDERHAVRDCPADGVRQRGVTSKAFKRTFGRSPGEYRRESLARPIRLAEAAPSR